MKENWMKKLLKLLNEYWKPSCRNKRWEKLDLECADRFYAISKYYEFIKRLVEKDKIDRHSKELELDMKRMRIPQNYYISWVQSLDLQHKKAQYLSLIALLSIQDNPIDFLVSILK